MPRFSTYIFALVALVLTSLCAQSSAALVPGDVTACSSIADAIPGLKTLASNPWNEANIMACTASGMQCTSTRVQTLDIRAAGLTGTFPESLSSLTDLTSLFFSMQLTGTLPSSWSALTSLYSLRLLGNSVISGTIPSSWSSLTSLTTIGLRFASDGQPFALPSWLGSVSAISITNAVLSEFPSFMATTSNTVGFLTLNNVKITSTAGLPSALFQSSAIGTFILEARDSLSFGAGTTLPSDWSAMTNLYSFSLSGIGVGGSIPQSLMNLPSLSDVSFAGLPSLTGNVPGPTTSASPLTAVNYENLALTGSIAPNLINAPNIARIYFAECYNLTGGLPELNDPASSVIESIYFQSNPLIGGPVPSTWVQISTLSSLSLAENGLTGTIPQSYGENTMSASLGYISLSGNQLTGTLPDLTAAPILSFIDFTNCGLTGTIPLSLAGRSWNGLYLAGNNFDMCANAGTSGQAALNTTFEDSGICTLEASAGRSDCLCLGEWPDKCFGGTTCPPLSPMSPITPPVEVPSAQPSSSPSTAPSSAPSGSTTPTSTPSVSPNTIPASVPTSVPTGSASSTSFGFGLLVAATLAVIYAF